MYNILCAFSVCTIDVQILHHASSRELHYNTYTIDYNTFVLNMYFIKASQYSLEM